MLTLRPISGKFRTLVVDCPWEYKRKYAGITRPYYATMTQKQLLDLPIQQWADRDCHLYLWATNSTMPQAFELAAAWGFEQKTILTLVKAQFGLGAYFRNQTEHVIFATRGKLNTRSDSLSTVFYATPTGHSEKPEEFYSLVRRASFPPYGEAFQRKARPDFVNLYAERNASESNGSVIPLRSRMR